MPVAETRQMLVPPRRLHGRSHERRSVGVNRRAGCADRGARLPAMGTQPVGETSWFDASDDGIPESLTRRNRERRSSRTRGTSPSSTHPATVFCDFNDNEMSMQSIPQERAQNRTGFQTMDKHPRMSRGADRGRVRAATDHSENRGSDSGEGSIVARPIFSVDTPNSEKSPAVLLRVQFLIQVSASTPRIWSRCKNMISNAW